MSAPEFKHLGVQGGQFGVAVFTLRQQRTDVRRYGRGGGGKRTGPPWFSRSGTTPRSCSTLPAVHTSPVRGSSTRRGRAGPSASAGRGARLKLCGLGPVSCDTWDRSRTRPGPRGVPSPGRGSAADASGPEIPDLLESKRRMARVGLNTRSTGRPARGSPPEAGDNGTRTPGSRNGSRRERRTATGSKSSSARRPAAFSRPAKMSASIRRSHWSARNSSNHCEKRSGSSAGRVDRGCSFFNAHTAADRPAASTALRAFRTEEVVSVLASTGWNKSTQRV